MGSEGEELDVEGEGWVCVGVGGGGGWCFFFFFFKQKTAYEMCGRDWSSDVCSSDLQTSSRSLGCSIPQYWRQFLLMIPTTFADVRLFSA